jgi:hypothetical protein
MEWILNPITWYFTVALALAGSLALFLSTKMELESVRRMAASARQDLKEIREAAEKVEEPAAEEPAAVRVPMLPPSPSGLNLSKRAQALRMHRRGEPVSSIAAALQAPQGEIQLLLKVHSLLNQAK